MHEFRVVVPLLLYNVLLFLLSATCSMFRHNGLNSIEVRPGVMR